MLQLTTEVDEKLHALMVHQLRLHNSARSAALRALRDTPADDERPLQLYALAEDGGLNAGLIGHSWGHWLHVDYLWVDERLRGTGVGTTLMARAEQIAREEHGCLHARVETWDFQAPDFYQKLGYRLVCQVADYPPGATDHLLIKPLR